MKYLFFDTENANHFNGISKMCSFGYVLCDEKFNIIEEDDLIINPESVFEREVINKILYYEKSYYNSHPTFKSYYEKIVDLFNNATIIGHAIDNDINSLNDATNRYKLPYINCTFYDTQRIYMEYKGLPKGHTPSLEAIAIELGIMEQGKKHRSLEDAKITMLGLKRLCEILNSSIDEVLNKFDHVIGYNQNGVMTLDRDSNLNNNRINKNNAKIYYEYLKAIKKTGNKKEVLKDIKISISSNYELFHFKEMLLIIKNITDLGGRYISKSTLSDIFVRYDLKDSNGNITECKRLNAVIKANNNGSNIKIITLDELFKLIDYNEEEIDDNYKLVCDTIDNKRNRVKKIKPEIEAYSLGNVFADFFKEFKN